jgi:hypothetical protein
MYLQQNTDMQHPHQKSLPLLLFTIILFRVWCYTQHLKQQCYITDESSFDRAYIIESEVSVVPVNNSFDFTTPYYDMISISRQRLGKHIPAATNTQAKIGLLPLLCSGAVNTTIE